MNLTVNLVMVVITRNGITGDQGWTFFFKRLVQLSIVFRFYKNFSYYLFWYKESMIFPLEDVIRLIFASFPCYFSPTHFKIQLLMFSCWTDSHAVLKRGLLLP